MITLLNDGGSSRIVTEGSILTSLGLELNEADFGTSDAASTTVDESQDASNRIEAFASSLANDLAVIEAREAFTQETINTLNASASDLTAADENEEGALLLALQTRQALGVTSLALSAQAQQSALRLF